MRPRPAAVVVACLATALASAGRREFGAELRDLTEEIAAKYLRKFRCVTYVSDGEGAEPRGRGGAFVIRLPSAAADDLLTQSFEQGCGGYVVSVGGAGRLSVARRLVEAKRRAVGYRYNNQRYVFLAASEEDADVGMLTDEDMFFLPNAVLVTPDGNGSYSVAGHTLLDHHKRHCLGMSHEVLDVWSPGAGFARGSDLFPDRVANVMGRKFVFAVVNYSPFSLVLKAGAETAFDGYETRIAATFVEKINGTWEGLDHPLDLWGEIFPNGSSTGIVGSVKEHRADFGFAAFYQWFCDVFDCTYPFYQSAVTCLVPRPELVSGWLTIVLPLAPDAWAALLAVYFVSSAFVLCLLLSLRHARGLGVRDGLGTALSDSFFTTFRLQLEQIPAVPRTESPLAVYVKVAVYYYFFVAAFWQGGIASILTVPRYEKPIDEVPDLLEKWPKLKWGANTNAWINSIKASSEPDLVQIVQKFVVEDDDALRRKTATKDFAFFVEKLPHGHYGYGDYIDEGSMKHLRLMESNVYTAFGVLNLPRGSPFSEKFDHTVLWMFDTGIVHKIEVQVSLDRINNRLQNMIRSSNVQDSGSVILALRHVQGPIFIYFGGMTAALLVFLAEVAVHRRTAGADASQTAPETAGPRPEDAQERARGEGRSRLPPR